jgi:hypothetical protein
VGKSGGGRCRHRSSSRPLFGGHGDDEGVRPWASIMCRGPSGALSIQASRIPHRRVSSPPNLSYDVVGHHYASITGKDSPNGRAHLLYDQLG